MCLHLWFHLFYKAHKPICANNVLYIKVVSIDNSLLDHGFESVMTGRCWRKSKCFLNSPWWCMEQCHAPLSLFQLTEPRSWSRVASTICSHRVMVHEYIVASASCSSAASFDVLKMHLISDCWGIVARIKYNSSMGSIGQ